MPIDFQAELKQVIDSHAAMYQAALTEGVKIGRREMRLELYPAMNEICDVLSILSPKSADAQKLIARIHKMFEEPAQ